MVVKCYTKTRLIRKKTHMTQLNSRHFSSNVTSLSKKQLKEVVRQEPEIRIVDGKPVHNEIHLYRKIKVSSFIEKILIGASAVPVALTLIADALSLLEPVVLYSVFLSEFFIGLIASVCLMITSNNACKGRYSQISKQDIEALDAWWVQKKINLSEKDRKKIYKAILNIEELQGYFIDDVTSQQYSLKQFDDKTWDLVERKNRPALSGQKITPLHTTNAGIQKLNENIARKITTLKSYDLTHEQARMFNTSVKKASKTSELVSKLYQLGDESHHQEVETILEGINNDLDAIKQSQTNSIMKKLAKVEERHTASVA